MPVWAWMGFALFIGYGAFVLWRAWAKRYFRYGPVTYSLRESPASFWFFALIFTAAELFLVTELGLVIASLVWGPVFHSH